MFLQLGELAHLFLRAALLTVLLLFLAFARAALALTENLLERPDLREIHIRRRAPHLAVRPDIVRPREPRHELIRGRAQLLQPEHMAEAALVLRRRALTELQQRRLRPTKRVGNAIRAQPEVIPHLARELNLLQRRHPLVAARRGELQLRRAIPQRIENKLRRHLVRAPVGIHEFERVSLAGHEREVCERGEGLHRVGSQRDDVALLLGQQPRGLHRLVELERVGERGAFHRADAARVLDGLLRQLRISRESQLRIRALQLGMLKHRHREVPRALAGELDAVAKILVHLRHGAAEDRVVERLCQRDGPRDVCAHADNECRAGRELTLELRQHHETVAALDLRVAGRDGDVVQHRFRSGAFSGDADAVRPQPHQRRDEEREGREVRDVRERELPHREGVRPTEVPPMHHGLGDDALLEKTELAIGVRFLLQRGEQGSL